VDAPYVLPRSGRVKGAKAKRAILFDGVGITKRNYPPRASRVLNLTISL
jgi:hypothetical protein